MATSPLLSFQLAARLQQVNIDQLNQYLEGAWPG
jgi:hypothetical protein